MQQDKDSAKKESKKPQRLGSLFTSSDTAVSSSSASLGSRDTTIGGSQKVKFAPTIPARRAKKPEPVSVSTEPAQPEPSTGGTKKGTSSERVSQRNAKRIEQVVTVTGPVSGIFSMQPNVGQSIKKGLPTAAHVGGGSKLGNARARGRIHEADKIAEHMEEAIDSRAKQESEVKFMDQGVSSPTTCSKIFNPDEWEENRVFLLQLESLPKFSMKSAIEHLESSQLSATETTQGKEMLTGEMGKIRIRQSGKIELLLGDTVFHLQPGSNASFMQSLAAVDNENRQFFDLGPVHERFSCIPELNPL